MLVNGDCLARVHHFAKSLDILDSIDVMQTVQAYRDFWKPESAGFRTRTVLLAESHKHTSVDEFNIQHRSDFNPAGDRRRVYPRNFVKFVYCLGYGEPSILVSKPPRVRGTPAFWRILGSCSHRIEDESSFQDLERSFPRERIHAKVKLLRALQRKGVWLVDASPIGIDVFAESARLDIMRYSWKECTSKTLASLTALERIVVIGSTVKNALAEQLEEFAITRDSIQIPPEFKQPRNEPYDIETCQRIYDACWGRS